jgi:transcriptional regulator with XRE-family HTH domain
MRTILHRQGDETVLASLGANVRALRRDQALSQSELALLAGVSRRMLVGIEGGRTNVSLSTVDKLAAALGVRFSRLVREPDAGDSRRIAALAWRGNSVDSRARLLGAAPASRETELWAWSLGVGEAYVSEDNSGSWNEILFVLEGRLTVRFADHERIIDAGDFLIFSRDDRYRFVNSGSGTLRFLRSVVL